MVFSSISLLYEANTWHVPYEIKLDLYLYIHIENFFYCQYFLFYSYTSIGSVHDTVPNALLCINNSSSSKEKFRPAYLLSDGRLERAGRAKKFSSPVCRSGYPAVSNGMISADSNKNGLLAAAVIGVGDEIL